MMVAQVFALICQNTIPNYADGKLVSIQPIRLHIKQRVNISGKVTLVYSDDEMVLTP